MISCNYTYCGHRFASADVCPVCGYPVSNQGSNTTDMAIASLPELHGQEIVDMHQIIPDREGMLQAQLIMMKALHISTALLQSVPTKVTSIKSNRALLEIKDQHPDKFIISHFMDPRHPLACRRLRQYKERGVKIIKLLPCLGYQPDDSKWQRFFSTMEKLQLVALIHTGFITARHKAEERKSGTFLNSKFGRPLYFDLLARKYPGINFILAHMGGSIWTHEAVEMVNQHENVWGDLSGSGLKALKRITSENIDVKWSKLFWGNDSSPFAYPYNLALLKHHLQAHKLEDLLPALLFDNGSRFIREHLS